MSQDRDGATATTSPNHPIVATNGQSTTVVVGSDNNSSSISNPPPSLMTTPASNSNAETKQPITWRSPQQDESNIIEIIEELTSEEPPSRPIKKSLERQQQQQQHQQQQQQQHGVSNNNTNNDNHHPSHPQQHQQHQHHTNNIYQHSSHADNDNSYNTAADARKNNQQQQKQLGSKPKSSNMSLLSSAVAHATLERCLLGLNGGETVVAAPPPPPPPIDNNGNDGNDGCSTNNNNGNGDGGAAGASTTIEIDYSKQCKPGHVIDILELRRLSSRGVPDEPPEVRARASSAPATMVPPLHPISSTNDPSSSSSNFNRHQHNSQHRQHQSTTTTNTAGGGSLQNPHRSYRPLVWRVLLGYLPPQTSLWNDVLSRDRKLYDTLVKELFSSTCPAPHDVYGEEELDRRRKDRERTENEVYRTDDRSGMDRSFVIDDDEDDDDEGNGGNEGDKVVDENAPPSTPGAPPRPPATATTPLTPGLLSARMQQEWVRGESGGKDALFHNNNNENNDGGRSSPGGHGNMARLSPMCAMNTPRTRIRKEVFKGRSSEHRGDGDVGMMGDGIGGDDNNDSLQYSGSNDQPSSAFDEVGLSDQMKESLLLPDDDEDDEEDEGRANMMDAIDLEGEGKDNDGVGPSQTTSDSPDAKFTHSISISNTTLEEEGVELCRQSSDDGDNDANAIPPVVDTDEEENIILLDEIRKDVIRTHPDLRFFLEPNEDLGQKRYASLERILFVWAKLNKGVRYVQGMNEIVGTLYFVLAHDSNEDWANQAEADTYFLFNSLMVEMRDVFVPDLDEADTGIHGRISNMITLLSLHDPEVRCHLDGVGIDPSFYSVRWLTTLLSREFLLPDTIRLWDSMFASTHKDNFLRYVSVTMVMAIRDKLLSGDFSACLRLLQAYPPTNLDRLLESSRALWIYESQITLACHKGGISLGHALRSIAPPPAIVMAYGLEGGVAPPIREQVRQAGERGLRVARGAVANGAIASSTVASAGRSFFGNARNFWRSGSSADSETKNGGRRPKSTSM